MSTDAPSAIQPEPRKSNLGCILVAVVGGLVVLGLACAGMIGAGIFGVFTLIKSSEPYEVSLSRAQQSVEVREALGEPIEAGTIVQGNINLNNDDGEADLSYSVSGPDGSGTVKVKGTKTNGQWDYEQMNVTIGEAGTVIDLRE